MHHDHADHFECLTDKHATDTDDSDAEDFPEDLSDDSDDRNDRSDEPQMGSRGPGGLPPVILGQALRKALGRQHMTRGSQADEPADRRVAPLVLDRACDVETISASWLWPGRIPRRRLTLLAGEPGSAASLVAIDIAARVSRGAAWPDESKPPDQAPHEARPEEAPTDEAPPEPAASLGAQQGADVIFCSKQDDLAETVVPGLARAGADMQRILCLDGVFHRPADPRACWTRELRFPEDFRSLRAAIRAIPGVRLVVLDPIEAFCTSALGRGPQYTEAAAAALVEIARDLDVAIVGVAELRRGTTRRVLSGDVRNRPLAAAAHAVWGIVRDPQRRDWCLMVPFKRGVGREEPPLQLKYDDGQIEWSPEPAELTTEQLSTGERAGLKSAVAAWLRGLLAEGSRAAIDIQELAKEMGFSRYLLRGVKIEIGVQVQKDGFRGKSQWSLPNATKETPENADAAADVPNENARIFENRPAPLEDSRSFSKGAGVTEGRRL